MPPTAPAIHHQTRQPIAWWEILIIAIIYIGWINSPGTPTTPNLSAIEIRMHMISNILIVLGPFIYLLLRIKVTRMKGIVWSITLLSLIGIVISIATPLLIRKRENARNAVLNRTDLTSQELHQALQRESDTINSGCPKIINAETELVSTFVSNDNSFTYRYRLLKQSSKEANKDNLASTVRPQILHACRTNPKAKLLFDRGASYSFIYYGNDQIELFTIKILSSDLQ